ncbi:DUF4912 domain-containing protein [Priestia aryabhattai]|uniref:DUF4912 domain-containing protein n=1 Tax=Priestia aryabhattai TaxID=412384 RepID=UPI002E2244E1|nr:DUF4912 domain-containing protein [Priestia aryabhattai]
MAPNLIQNLNVCIATQLDSSRIYVHWSFSEHIREMVEIMFSTRWEELNLAMCTYDITGLHFNGHESNRYYMKGLTPKQAFIFMNSLESERTYVIDIGIQDKEGSFFSLLRSNPVYLMKEQHEQVNVTSLSWMYEPVKVHQGVQNEFSTYSLYSNDLEQVKKQYE